VAHHRAHRVGGLGGAVQQDPQGPRRRHPRTSSYYLTDLRSDSHRQNPLSLSLRVQHDGARALTRYDTHMHQPHHVNQPNQSMDGSVESINQSINRLLPPPSPPQGYVIHEAACWSDIRREWVFLPRRVRTHALYQHMHATHPLACISVCLSICMSVGSGWVFLPRRVRTHARTHARRRMHERMRRIRLSVCIFNCLSVCLPACLPVNLSVSLPVSLSLSVSPSATSE